MLEIKRYDKDVGTMVIWGWDLIKVNESKNHYLYQFLIRSPDVKKIVYAMLNRNSTLFAKATKVAVYELSMFDHDDTWRETIWVGKDDLTSENFFSNIETILNKHYKNI